jgi:hypothetical protein
MGDIIDHRGEGTNVGENHDTMTSRDTDFKRIGSLAIRDALICLQTLHAPA